MGFVPAAIATHPSRANRPSTKLYAGSIVALRRMVFRLRDERVAVTECGYMNSAIAEPNASVAYAQKAWADGMNTPIGFPVAGLTAFIFACAAANTCAHPPTFAGR